PSAAAVSDNVDRSVSAPLRVFGSPATIIKSDAPSAAASADAEPPPGVGSDELNEASRSRSGLSASAMPAILWNDDAPFLDHRVDRRRRHANQIDRRAVDDHGIHLFPRLEAADGGVAIERVGGVERRADQRFLEGQVHPEAGERHREWHRW